VLKERDSSYLGQFQELAKKIQIGSKEAEDNLRFLSQLQAPSEELAKAEPKDIPKILPKILNIIRLIWSISRYYNTRERITHLLCKVSNEIIRRCTAHISLPDLFGGQVEKSIASLNASIAAGESWRQIYQHTGMLSE